MRARSFRSAALLIPFATVAIALPAAAQQHPMPAQAPAMQQCMDMMGGPPAALLLEHREALSLTAEQVGRLEAIRDRTQAIGEHMQPVRAAHMRAAELLRADTPDFDEYEDALEEAAEHMVEAHVALVRANFEAREVLTAEQRATLQTLRPMHAMPPGADAAAMPRMPARPDTAGPPRMDAGQPRAGMSDMQHMHQMMMMHCMMMGADEHEGGHDG